MNYKKNFLLIAAIALLSVFGLNAQDAKVPGGDEKIPLGVDARNGKFLFAFRRW